MVEVVSWIRFFFLIERSSRFDAYISISSDVSYRKFFHIFGAYFVAGPVQALATPTYRGAI